MKVTGTFYDDEELKKIIRDSVREEFQKILKMLEESANTKYLTRKETAAKLRISLPTLNEYTKNGKLIGHRLTGRVLYREDEINDALNAVEPLKYRRS